MDKQRGQRAVLEFHATSHDVPYISLGLRDGMNRWDSELHWGKGCPMVYPLGTEEWDGVVKQGVLVRKFVSTA